MSKAILILDKSKTCGTCRLCVREQSIVVGMPSEQYEKSFCGYTKEKVDIKTIHKYCPLNPLPETLACLTEEEGDFNYDAGYNDGYNACLDEISGGKK